MKGEKHFESASPEQALAHAAKERAKRRRNTIARADQKIENEMNEYGGSDIKEELQRMEALLSGGVVSEIESDSEGQEGEGEDVEDVSEQLSEEMVKFGSEGFHRMSRFMHVRNEVENIAERLEVSLAEKLKKRYANPTTRDSATLSRELIAQEEQLRSIDEKLDVLARQNPEAFLSHWLLRLREYKKQMDDGGFVETPGVKRMISAVYEDSRRKLEGRNGVITFLGPTGSGKTVVARGLAKDLSPDGKYEFVSAHSKMTPEDLLFRSGIQVSEMKPEDVPGAIRRAQEMYRAEHPEAEEKDLVFAEKTIEETVKSQAAQRQLETTTVLEAVIRAAEKGCKVVIDEFNYLPPETLASLNNLLNTQTDAKATTIMVGNVEKKITAKQGFGIILTGNVGKEFLQRQKLDPAFVNRALAGIIEYTYPPQEFDKSFEDSIVSSDEIKKGVSSPSRDLFISGLAELSDKKGNIELPKDAMVQLWDLCRVFSIAQQVAGGKEFREFASESEIQDVTAIKFHSVFLSFRNFNEVVRNWELEGFTRPIDNYIFKNIIAPANIVESRDAAELFFLFQRGGFFQGDQWKDITVETTKWTLRGISSAPTKEDLFDTPQLEYLSPQEIAEALSGQQMPTYAETVSSESTAETEQQRGMEVLLAEVHEILSSAERALGEEEGIEVLCQ